jgi:hypothetical protein
MSLSSLALNAQWRDYWGMWNPMIEPFLAPLEASDCLALRWAVLPQLQYATFGPTGKITYNFHLIPGSIIWGMWSTLSEGEAVTVQLTDTSLGHQFFQEPIQANQLQSSNAAGVYLPSATLLPPHPVVGDGLFTFEAWGPVNSFFVALLGVAEVTDCPVR